jgi:peptidoglycan hydrolase-like protein with peptidoglycan-binding domain
MKKYFLRGLFLTTAFAFTVSTVSALTISPARAEFVGKPGETITSEFTLINPNATDETYYTSVESFDTQGTSGTPSFTTSKVGLPSWLKIARKVTIKKDERMKIPYSIIIPKDVTEEGYFGAIFLTTTLPQTSDTQSSGGAKMGMLVMLKVTSLTSSSSCVVLTKALSKGQENSEVLTLQQFLVDGGYMAAKPDGYFRASTVTALKKFQIANGLSPVGSVGVATRGKVKEVSCKRKFISASSTAEGVATSSEAIAVVGDSMIRATEQTLVKVRNSKRNAEVAALTLAVAQYMESNNGKVPTSITSTPKETCISREFSCAGMIEPWLAPMYIPYMPVEPGSTKKNGSGYLFSKKGRTVTVASQYAEGGVVIKRDYFSDSGVVNYGTTTATELPKIPDEKTSSTTLAGTDSNNNGVRDDIELLLSQKAKSPNDLPYLLLYAKEYQKEITGPTPKSRGEALKIISKVSCTEKQNLKNGMDSKAMEAFDIYVQSQYINTPERKKTWSDFYNVVVSFTGEEINKIPCDNS